MQKGRQEASEEMNDNQSKTINDWLLQNTIKDYGNLAFVTTPIQRAKAAIEMLHENINKK